MKKNIFVFLVLSILACDFKSSVDYNNEAEKLERQGKHKEAIELLDEAIAKDSQNIYALINRGVDKSILKDHKGAIEDYSKVIKIDPDNALAFLNRGKNKKRLNDFQGAIKDFENAIKTKGSEHLYINKLENSFVDTRFEFDVKMEEIRFERGIARFNIESLKLALDDFKFCIKEEYEVSASYYWRGVIYLNYGMTGAGCTNLKKSKELGNLDAQELINKYCEK